MNNFKLDDLVYYKDDKERIFTIVGIRESEVEIMDEDSCIWVYLSDVKLALHEETDIEDWKNVKHKIEEEGMDYCFNSYSDWSEIKDKTFHKLRLEYLNKSKELKKYINEQINELE